MFPLDISAHCFIHLLSFVTDTSQGKNVAMLLLLGNQHFYCSVNITLKSKRVTSESVSLSFKVICTRQTILRPLCFFSSSLHGTNRHESSRHFALHIFIFIYIYIYQHFS